MTPTAGHQPPVEPTTPPLHSEIGRGGMTADGAAHGAAHAPHPSADGAAAAAAAETARSVPPRFLPPPCFLPPCDESKRYILDELIGKGSYGEVVSATDRLTGERVAIKRIANVFDNVADAVRILRELKLLRLMCHPDVVQIKHVLLPSDARTFRDLHIVFELMDSDLHTVVGANPNLTAGHHKVIMYQLLRGMAHMHAHGVLHRDVKPKNVLVNSNCKLKLCDLGLSRLAAPGETACAWTDYVATRWYRAPELCGCFYGAYTSAVDMWSLGCVFGEMLQQAPLFPGADAVSQLRLITDLVGSPTRAALARIANPKASAFLSAMPAKPGADLAARFPGADDSALQLLRGLLAFDPTERLSAADALAMPYFEGLPPVVEHPPAGLAAEFEFDSQQLSEADVRSLIFSEVLHHYHPHWATGVSRAPRHCWGWGWRWATARGAAACGPT
uniref:Mitogen-activated protein kinase n=1 Tax=Chlamydomonas euryale TaxID=1486919 RepID=A0A7R9VBB0_9CHLO|mmetsp:Transcript_27500/g.81493  ORF Transcript_27500/g.81493 Transcript_27500/m.81493 type:complete len:446 (+) Transcript_27500:396-1733(+)